MKFMRLSKIKALIKTFSGLLPLLAISSFLLSSCAITKGDRLFSTDGDNPFAEKKAASQKLEYEQGNENSSGGVGGFFQSLFQKKDNPTEPKTNAIASNTDDESAQKTNKKKSSSGLGGFFSNLFSRGKEDQQEEQETPEQTTPTQSTSTNSSTQKKSTSISTSTQTQPWLPPLPEPPPIAQNKLPTTASKVDLARQLLLEEQARRTQSNAEEQTQAPPPINRVEPSDGAAPRLPQLVLPSNNSLRTNDANSGTIATPENPLGLLQLP